MTSLLLNDALYSDLQQQLQLFSEQQLSEILTDPDEIHYTVSSGTGATLSVGYVFSWVPRHLVRKLGEEGADENLIERVFGEFLKLLIARVFSALATVEFNQRLHDSVSFKITRIDVSDGSLILNVDYRTWFVMDSERRQWLGFCLYVSQLQANWLWRFRKDFRKIIRKYTSLHRVQVC